MSRQALIRELQELGDKIRVQRDARDHAQRRLEELYAERDKLIKELEAYE